MKTANLFDTKPYILNNISTSLIFAFKGLRPSDKFDNPCLKIPWVANANSVHLYALVSGTCFRVHVTLLYQ